MKILPSISQWIFRMSCRPSNYSGIFRKEMEQNSRTISEEKELTTEDKNEAVKLWLETQKQSSLYVILEETEEDLKTDV